jgi:hypothetical protein
LVANGAHGGFLLVLLRQQMPLVIAAGKNPAASATAGGPRFSPDPIRPGKPLLRKRRRPGAKPPAASG